LKKVSKPQFWNKRYLDYNTAWDIGNPTPILTNYLKKNKKIGKICVLGCGNGHDALEFARYKNDVYAVDFADQALKNLKKASNKNNLMINLVNEDIFNLQKDYSIFFDLVFEYTCFCAIDPMRRKEYFEVVHGILKRGALLFAIFIPLDKSIDHDGPPFGVDLKQIENLASNKFEIIENKFSDLSIKPRKNREKLVILKKK
jgi:SAM-dependent methyltransferase